MGGGTGPCCPGPTGAPGAAITSTFAPSKVSSYQPGQLITSGNAVYVVGKAGPAGAPGSSSDYIPIAGPAGRTGSACLTRWSASTKKA